jgi:outer membrane protein assembly factor BamB
VDGGRVYFGSRDHNLYCLEAETGRLLWKFKTQDEIVSVPVVYRNRVYIGSFDRNLYCLDAETGGLLWKFTTQGEVHNMTPFLVHNGILHFTSFDNNLYAVDAETGRLVWKFPTGIYGNAAIPTLYGGILYHTNRDGNLFAISLEGKLIWKFTNKEHLSVPVIYEGRIFVGSEDMNLYCLSMDGRKLWSFRTEGAVFVNSAARDGRLFFPSWDCNLYCLEIATRRLVWKFRAEGSPSYLPPPYESFEVVMKIPAKEIQEERDKRYDFSSGGDAEREGAYKSRQTYRVSTQYREKGKYQVDSGEEAF